MSGESKKPSRKSATGCIGAIYHLLGIIGFIWGFSAPAGEKEFLFRCATGAIMAVFLSGSFTLLVGLLTGNPAIWLSLLIVLFARNKK